MSSFWNWIGGKDGKPAEEGAANGEPQIEPPLTTQEAAPVSATEPRPVPQLPPQRAVPRYGVDDAIKLMRTLPVDDNVDLIVRVIKRTLESMDVRVPDIIADAADRQDALRGKIGDHENAIVQLERDIENRRQEIARLEDELAETTTVRERLQLAEAMSLASTPVAPPAKVTPSPAPPAVSKKAEVPPPPPGILGGAPLATQRSAPPMPPPTTFRPAVSPSRKPPAVAPPPIPPAAATPKEEPRSQASESGHDDDDDLPVESRDLIEKAP